MNNGEQGKNNVAALTRFSYVDTCGGAERILDALFCDSIRRLWSHLNIDHFAHSSSSKTADKKMGVIPGVCGLKRLVQSRKNL